MSLKKFGLKMALFGSLLAGLLLSQSVFAAEMYKVNASFYHLGQLVAQPQLELPANETRGGRYTQEDGRSYRFVVQLRPVADNQAYVSLQYTAGDIDIQPNILVEYGKEASATVDDKVRLTLLVQRVANKAEGEKLTMNDTGSPWLNH